MENSRKVILPEGSDQEATWFIVQGDRWIGPFNVAEIYEKVQSQEISWAHFAWKTGNATFKRLCDIEEFQSAVPPEPTQSLLKRIPTETQRKPPKPPKVIEETKVWYLHYNDSQFGPFSKEEVSRLLRVGQIHRKIYIWKDGMEDWEKIEDVPDFHLVVEEMKDTQEEKSAVKSKIRDQRSAPRRPLVARIFLVKDDSVVVAVCRDISVGGMQVLTDRIPGKAGAKIKMNVSPSGGELGGQIRPFVAEGTIVRILEDQRGFSFRFERLPDDAKRAIESYIASTD